MLSESGFKREQVLDSFVEILRANNDLRIFPQISKEIERLEFEKKGIKLVNVVSARKLSHNELSSIKSVLSRVLGKKIELRPEIDESLIGGIKVRVDDLVLDTTIKNVFEQLKMNLIS
jgi:F-type H+-transporting ATPase subunit delta